jgi:hypothetical protein
MPSRKFRWSRPFRDGLFFGLSLVGIGSAGLACGDAPPSPPSAATQAAETARRPMIKQGMTMAQVVEIWGVPDVKVRHGGGERWSYWVRDRRQRLVGKAYVIFDDGNRVSEIVTRPDRNLPELEREPRAAT